MAYDKLSAEYEKIKNGEVLVELQKKISQNISGDYNLNTKKPKEDKKIKKESKNKDKKDKNMTLCEEDCDFKEYDSKTENVLCSCDVKIKLPLISEISFNKEKLYDKFININNSINIKIIKCYYILFNKEGISKNISIYIILPIIIFHLVTIIIFYTKDYKKLNFIINNILSYKNETIKELV